jgi:hypothetical protein
MLHRPWLICAVFLLGPSTCLAQRARVPVRLEWGWQTVLHRIGDTAADSPVNVAGDGKFTLSYAQDQFGVVLPFWYRSQGFVLSPPFAEGDTPDDIGLLVNQDPAAIAAATGVPVRLIRRPWLSYVPLGWPLVGIVAGLLYFFRSPSAATRFGRLWSDPRYRGAIALLLDAEYLVNQNDPRTIAPVLLDVFDQSQFDEAVEALTEAGLPRWRVERDLDFALRYLADNGRVFIRPETPED